VPVASVPAIASVGAIDPPDPIFALIEAQEVACAECSRCFDVFWEFERQAKKTHGPRPSGLIAWRYYGAIGDYGIDEAREKFLNQPGANREQVEAEYQDAKRRLATRGDECLAWEHRTGVAPFHEQAKRALESEDNARMKMTMTAPTTLAGMAALIDLVREDLADGMDFEDDGWRAAALETVASALTWMNKDAA
jgi:hypothetical protein